MVRIRLMGFLFKFRICYEGEVAIKMISLGET